MLLNVFGPRSLRRCHHRRSDCEGNVSLATPSHVGCAGFGPCVKQRAPRKARREGSPPGPEAANAPSVPGDCRGSNADAPGEREFESGASRNRVTS